MSRQIGAYAAGREAGAESCKWLRHYDPGVPPHLAYPRIPLYCLLDETAARHPTNPCTNFFGKRLTYQQIKELSDHLAASVRNLGIRKGDRVVMLLPNSPQFLIAYYGLLKAGAVIVPLNPLSAERELVFHFSDSEAETAFTIPLFLNKVASLRGKTLLKRVICSRLSDFLPFPLNLAQGFQEWRLVRGLGGTPRVDFTRLLEQAPPADWRPEPVQPDDVAVLIYSGGTTGVAKGITLSHYTPDRRLGASHRRAGDHGRLAALSRLWHECDHERARVGRWRDHPAAALQGQRCGQGHPKIQAILLHRRPYDVRCL